MPKRKANSNLTSSPWTPVSVHLGKDDKVDFDIDCGNNHYDNEKLSKKAAQDLPVAPGEDVGFFLGLEVLSGDSYQLVKEGSSQRLIIKETLSTKEENKKDTKKRKQESTEQPSKRSKATKEERKEVSSEKVPRESSETAEPSKSKKKRRKRKKETEKKKSDSNDHNSTSEIAKGPLQAEEDLPVDEDQLFQLQQSWSQASGGAILHRQLLTSLIRRNFTSPMPIQAATLSAAVLGRRNLVGAAPTGSGKTLAFLLPILQHLLDREDPGLPLAMIVTPTRELATQIHQECDKLLPNKCVSLVGGIALVKQERLLRTKRPPVIIGTPGRLWAMVSSGEHDHLKDLSQLHFLVLDEADRMTQEHCFPQLVNILDSIHEANPRGEDEEDDESDEEDDDDPDRLLGLPGIRGEAQLTMLTDNILEQVEAHRKESPPETRELSDSEFQDGEDDEELRGDELVLEPQPKIHRQTFIFSATLTLPFTSTKQSKPSNKKRKKLNLDGGIAEILEKTRAMGETKVVDLSSSSLSAKSISSVPGTGGVRLPPGLRLEQIKCTQKHKDSHLYAYLLTTVQGSSGPCLVFCNSIAAVRRVGITLQTLGLPVRILHAHMQQRARFKAVESLNESKTRAVVVCTDVASRGLDIPSVSTVVHYDVARAVDTFVHRSGRTARGIGAGAVGSSLSLVSPAEDKAQSKITEALGANFSKVLLDGRLMASAEERTSLASKIVTASEMEQRTQSSHKWFLEKAKEAEIELDDDLMEDNRDQNELMQLKEAKKAKVKLAHLLAEPMTTQRFGKFLSTNSAAVQNEIKQLVVPLAASKKKGAKRRGS